MPAELRIVNSQTGRPSASVPNRVCSMLMALIGTGKTQGKRCARDAWFSAVPLARRHPVRIECGRRCAMSQRIEDYALIGDCQTAALVGKDGSIDWLCVPRFDSGACFAALLGTPEHGRWLITPVGAARSIRRRYRDSTLILETEYDTDEGTVTLIDFMPPRNGPPELVRLVEGKRGTMRMRTELTIRFDYGSIVPWVRRLEGDHGLRAIAGPDTLYCRTKVPLKGQNMHTAGDFTVAA